MRWRCALISLAIVPSLLSAQDSTPSNPPPQVKPDDLCTVEGVVVNAVTGDPIKNISITLRPLGERGQASNALTDVSGRFAFQNLTPGRYVIQAAALGPNWARSALGNHRVHALDAGRHVCDIVLRLQPGGVITGTVYDEDSQPAVGAQVQAFAAGRGNSFGFSAAGQTNDLGEYRLYGIPAGKYYVVATGNRTFGFNTATNDEVYLPTLYPGTSDAGQALPVEVRAGDELRGIDLGLILTRGVTVRGRVVTPPASKSNVSFYVQLLPRDTPPDLPQQFTQYGAGTQSGTGNFEIHGVPPGAYYLSANWADGKGFYYGQLPVEVAGEDLEGVALTLSPGFSLQGRVIADPGMLPNFAQLSIYLEPIGTPRMGAGGARINPDGTFAIENVFEGDYRLHVAGFPEELYVRSAKWGGSDALSSFNIAREQAGGTLIIDLALDGGRVDGTVLQDKLPVPGAFVALVPDPPNRNREDLYSQTSADQLGRFSLLGLPPGDFKLFAWELGENVNYRDPEFLKNYENHGAHVHIEAKKQQYVQLELTAAEEAPQ